MSAEPASAALATARSLAKLLGTFHNISYYAPEMKAFGDVGLPEYWRAYMAYRSAPMGVVAASVVQATFYNFSASHVQSAIPSAWETTSPAEALALRDRCIAEALARGFTTANEMTAEILEASSLALSGVAHVDAGARPLFGAHRDLPVPDEPLMRLWYACTLWREHRGDGHNIALAAADIDGVECHLLLAAKGVGAKDIIGKIRGWSGDEWDAAQARLAERMLLTATGEFTDAGRQLRADVETHTDALAAAPRLALGDANCARLIELVEPLVAQLIQSGVVPGRWPPKDTPNKDR